MLFLSVTSLDTKENEVVLTFFLISTKRFVYSSRTMDGNGWNSCCIIKEEKLNETECIIPEVVIKEEEGQVLSYSGKMSDSECSQESQSEGDNSKLSATSPSNFHGESQINSLTILDGKFFKVVRYNSKKIVGRCVKCEPKTVDISGALKSSSNFLKHLTRVHGIEAVKEYKNHLRGKVGRKTMISNNFKLNKCRNTFTQEDFEERIVKFITHTMTPLNIVEDPTFLHIFSGFEMSNLGLHMLSRSDLGRKLDHFFLKNGNKIKSVLSKISYLCTTADICSSRKRSYLCETCHWIHPETFQRVSVVLACKRIRGSRTAEKISDLQSSIHDKYNIKSCDIVATITNNASSFGEAFKDFGIKPVNIRAEQHQEIDCETSCDDGCDSNSDDYETTDDSFEMDVSNPCYAISNHITSNSHILNLCVTVDLYKAIRWNETLNITHKSVINKCNAFWKALMRPKAAKTIYSIVKFIPSLPIETRWNSLQIAFEDILRLKEKRQDIYCNLNDLDVGLTDADFLYISEFITCTKPIAEALDILQDDKYCYYGCVVPTLVSLRRKLQRLVGNDLSFCRPIAESLLNSLETRFYDIFHFSTPESIDAGIAALSHPKFKNNWLPCYPENNQTLIRTAFQSAVMNCFSASVASESTGNSQPKDDCLDFFDFGESNKMEPLDIQIKVELLILNFFCDTNEELSMLHRFPEIKAVFLQYNTPIPSSAPVERLFSFESMKNMSIYNHISDKKFEQCVVLKANFNFLNGVE